MNEALERRWRDGTAPFDGQTVSFASGDLMPLPALRLALLDARAGIEDYWIVSLPDGVLEVHRQPAAMADQPLGHHHYRSITRLTSVDTLAPLGRPDAAIAVSALLP